MPDTSTSTGESSLARAHPDHPTLSQLQTAPECESIARLSVRTCVCAYQWTRSIAEEPLNTGIP